MADSDFVAVITCNGQRYTAWESVMVRRDFGNGVSVFQFTPCDGSFGPNNSGLKIAPGDQVTIELADKKAFAGYCKIRSGAYDDKSHQLVIAGESMTVDLVRSSVVVKPGSYDGSTFEQAARAVMQPHPVQLKIKNAPDIASKPIKNLSVQFGETVAEFVSRVAQMRGLFISDDVDGNVVAGQGDPGAAPVATLVEGKNILRASFKLEDPSACSFNKLSGVSQTGGDDQNWPPRSYSATATNDEVRKNVTRLFIAEHPSDAQDLAQRVNHEATRSAWPIVNIPVTVVGWLRPDGELWEPTDNVSIWSPMIFPTQDAMYTAGIQSVTYAQDSQNGTTTVLELVRPDALTSAPTSGLSDTGGGGPALPSAAKPDTPDYQTST